MKYSRKVFYDALWNTDPALLEARGHVVDQTDTVVIRPFTKIFNRGENDTDINRDEQVTAIRKVNGFMAAATFVPSVGEVVISTTGSLDSDFVGYAETYITDRVKKVIVDKYNLSRKALTYMFEICHPDDPHIVEEVAGAYLIGARLVESEAAYKSDSAMEVMLDRVAGEMGVMRPTWKTSRFGDVVELAKTCRHEGYVVYGKTTALKIKSPFYLTLKACARKADILSLDKKRVDEEYYALVDHVKSLGVEFNSRTEQDRIAYMVAFLEDNVK